MAPKFEYRDLFVKELVDNYVSSLGEVSGPDDDVVKVFTNIAVMLTERMTERFEYYANQHRQQQLNNEQMTPANTQNAVMFTEDSMSKIFQEKCASPSMRDVHRKAMRKCHLRIIDDLDLSTTSVLDELFQEDIISVCEKDSIVGKNTSRMKNQELLSILEGRISLPQFNSIFLPILRIEHKHIADELQGELENMFRYPSEESQCPVCKMKDVVEVMRIALPLYQRNAISTALYNDLRGSGLSNRLKWEEIYANFIDNRDVIESLSKKYADLYEEFQIASITTLECHCRSQKKEPSDVFGADDDVDVANLMDVMEAPNENPVDAVYKMTARPRGICLIINNREFKYGTTRGVVTQRKGTDADVERLKYIFGKLQFSVQLLENLTASEMRETMERMAKVDHTPYDCFACVILSHCDSDSIIGVNGQQVPTSKLTAPFKASCCPTLAGKPKLFFVQGARGKELMRGFQIKGEEHEANNIIPDEADFLLSYSTPPGYVSYRSRSKGSWYVVTLSEVLEKFGESEDILSCLVLMNNAMSKGSNRRDEVIYKQVSSPVFTLTKKIHLTSDPTWSKSLKEEVE